MSTRGQEMASRSSLLAWKILWTEEPSGLLSMGSLRVGHDRSYLAAAAEGRYSFPSEVSSGLTGSCWKAGITDDCDILVY